MQGMAVVSSVALQHWGLWFMSNQGHHLYGDMEFVYSQRVSSGYSGSLPHSKKHTNSLICKIPQWGHHNVSDKNLSRALQIIND